jgi:hypothetical protein
MSGRVRPSAAGGPVNGPACIYSCGAEEPRRTGQESFTLLRTTAGGEWIYFDDGADRRVALRARSRGLFPSREPDECHGDAYQAQDVDDEPKRHAHEITRSEVSGQRPLPRRWKRSGGTSRAKALRVRATVAHDSYERLVEVSCAPRADSAIIKPHKRHSNGNRGRRRV